MDELPLFINLDAYLHIIKIPNVLEKNKDSKKQVSQPDI